MSSLPNLRLGRARIRTRCGLRDCIGFTAARRCSATSGVYQLRFEQLSVWLPALRWRDLYERCHYCHYRWRRGRRMIDGMTLLIVFIAMLIVLAIAAILDMTPDTHREVGPHGDFKF